MCDVCAFRHLAWCFGVSTTIRSRSDLLVGSYSTKSSPSNASKSPSSKSSSSESPSRNSDGASNGGVLPSGTESASGRAPCCLSGPGDSTSNAEAITEEFTVVALVASCESGGNAANRRDEPKPNPGDLCPLCWWGGGHSLCDSRVALAAARTASGVSAKAKPERSDNPLRRNLGDSAGG